MQNFQDQVRFESSTEFLQIPTRRPTKLIGTSPNVFGNEYWKANNNGTIVNFTKGAEGQTLRILGDGTTTVTNNTSIKTNTGADKVLVANVVYIFVLFDNIWFEIAASGSGGGGGGEINTASNLGSGVGIYASKSGVDLRFKSLVAGTGISISATATEITITNTGSVAGSFVAKAGDTMTGTLYMNNGPQVVIGDKADSLARATITSGLHTQLVFDAPNVNMIGVSNIDSNSSQWAGTVRSNMFSLANSDGGWRIWQNYHQTNSAFGVYETHRPSSTTACDSAAVFSYKFIQPANYGASPYGSPQTLIIHGAGLGVSPSGGANPYDETDEVNIATMQGTRKLGFAVSPTDNNPQNAIRLNPNVTDRVELYISGALRQVHAFNDGAGHNVLYY